MHVFVIESDHGFEYVILADLSQKERLAQVISDWQDEYDRAYDTDGTYVRLRQRLGEAGFIPADFTLFTAWYYD